MDKDVLRLIDANFNRAREGLRVCEDIARFLLDSGPLTKQLKSVRHGIAGIISDFTKFNFVRLSDFRDSINDVGKASRRRSEMTRRDCRDIFIANIERVKESLRVLEEFFKLIDKNASARLSRLRFRVYDIEKRSVKKVAGLAGKKFN